MPSLAATGCHKFHLTYRQIGGIFLPNQAKKVECDDKFTNFDMPIWNIKNEKCFTSGHKLRM